MIRTGQSKSLFALVCGLAALGVACGGKEPEPAQPNAYNGQYPQQQQPGYQQPGQYPQQQQPGQYPQQQPGQYPQQTTGQQPGTTPSAQPQGGFQIPGLNTGTQPAGASGGTAQALDPNLAALATGPLGMYANTEAPGMAKDGPIVAGNFQEGQTLEGTFTFQPGKCYTLVAAGAGISSLKLEMQYVTPLPGLAPQIGQSSQNGSQVSIGGKANCLRPISPFPANAKFIVRAVKGGGVAAAQLYSK